MSRSTMKAEAMATPSLAVLGPGPDFAMVTRNSYLFGRTAGLLTAAGIALGVQVHVAYTLLGVSVFLQHSPSWILAVKLIGAGYLVHIGVKTATNQAPRDIDQSAATLRSRHRRGAGGPRWCTGLCQSLNPTQASPPSNWKACPSARLTPLQDLAIH